MRIMNRLHDLGCRRVSVLYSAAALAFILSVCSLQAQFMVRPVNLAYLSQRADVIVQGRVMEVRHERLPGYSHIPTVVVTLEVDAALRGPSGKTYTFREVFVGLRSREGKQGYQVGQQLFLFLPSPSQYGLSSPVGMGQGRFHISRNFGGGSMVINEQGNAGLFKNVEQDASKAGMRLTKGQLRLAAVQGGPVSLDEFASLVKSLTALPRIK
jgi:hypothetical protein